MGPAGGLAFQGSGTFFCHFPLTPVQIAVELMPGNRPLGYGQDPSMPSSSL